MQQRSPPSFGVQVLDLLLIELTNWRWAWRTLVLTSTITPLVSMLALGVFGRDSGARTLAYIMTGNVVISLMFDNMGSVNSRFSFMRWSGALDYFATLPIRRAPLILAVAASFLLLSLPSLVVTIFVGAWLLGVPLQLHPLLLLVVPLCALPLASLGALTAYLARAPETAGALNLLLTLLLAGLGPVVVPPERLPAVLHALGWFSPAKQRRRCSGWLGA